MDFSDGVATTLARQCKRLAAMTGLCVAAATATAFGPAPQAWAYEYGPVYATCSDAHDAGVYNIPEDDPAYWPDGDRDGDGYACEPPSN